MIKITLIERHYDKPFVDMSVDELQATMQASWVLQPARARNERYAIGVGSGPTPRVGRCVIAMEIDGIVPAASRDPNSRRLDRYRIVGRALEPGHPVHDAYVGSLIEATRNPVRYVASEFDFTPCRCGCGGPARAAFLPGHNQRAIRERVDKFGSVEDFVDWFDTHYSPEKGRARC